MKIKYAGVNTVLIAVESTRPEKIRFGNLELYTPTNRYAFTPWIDRRSGIVAALPSTIRGRLPEIDYESGVSWGQGIHSSEVPVNFSVGDRVVFPSNWFEDRGNDGHPTRFVGKWDGMEHWSIPYWSIWAKFIGDNLYPLNGWTIVKKLGEEPLKSNLILLDREEDPRPIRSEILAVGDDISLYPRNLKVGDRVVNLPTGVQQANTDDSAESFVDFLHRRHIIAREGEEIEPFATQVVVDVDPIETKTAGGLFIPEKVIQRRERSGVRRGTIVSAGPYAKVPVGARVSFVMRSRNTSLSGRMIIDSNTIDGVVE